LSTNPKSCRETFPLRDGDRETLLCSTWRALAPTFPHHTRSTRNNESVGLRQPPSSSRVWSLRHHVSAFSGGASSRRRSRCFNLQKLSTGSTSTVLLALSSASRLCKRRLTPGCDCTTHYDASRRPLFPPPVLRTMSPSCLAHPATRSLLGRQLRNELSRPASFKSQARLSMKFVSKHGKAVIAAKPFSTERHRLALDAPKSSLTIQSNCSVILPRAQCQSSAPLT
jgi:hypothetical protein